MTLRKNYSNIAKGVMAANRGWMRKLNAGFDFPDKIPAQGGTATVEMWAPFTTYTPTPGTIQTNQANNLLVDLTVGITGTNIVKNGAQKRAMEYNGAAMVTAAEQAGDALVKVAQDAVVAGLVAGTPGLTVTLPVGSIDFAIPTAATNPDIINAVWVSLARVVNYVKARAGGTADMVILCAEAAYSKLEAVLMTAYRPPQLGSNAEGQLNWNGIPIENLYASTTSFGGASVECLFVLSGRGYAYLGNDPELAAPSPDGWMYRSDNVWSWDWEMPYAHGVANTSLIAAILNPAT
jgi:hypothetical protein